MGHLLKIKCVDSRVNVHILASTKGLIYTHDGASAKFSTNSHETDNSSLTFDVDGCCTVQYSTIQYSKVQYIKVQYS